MSSLIKEASRTPIAKTLSFDDLHFLFSDRTQNMKRSVIRNLLNISPDVISLGGGFPAPETFPVELIPQLQYEAYQLFGSRMYQYGSTEGLSEMREAGAAFIASNGAVATSETTIVGTGSQGLLDGIGSVFLNESDIVVVEAPTYLGATQAFSKYGARFREVEMDGEGMIPEALEETLKDRDVKFIYSVPTFQNPTGRTISYSRRVEIAEIIEKYNAILVEDDPYSRLRFEGDSIPPIQSLIPENVIYLTTVSKVLAPAFRIGFATASSQILQQLVTAKQGTDLFTSSFNQAIATIYLRGGYVERQIPKTIELYRQRRDVMLDAIKDHFPPGFKVSQPQGGMFLWVEVPEELNTTHLLKTCIENKVAYVPGEAFFTKERKGGNTMRLNFSNSNAAKITHAIKTIGEVLKFQR